MNEERHPWRVRWFFGGGKGGVSSADRKAARRSEEMQERQVAAMERQVEAMKVPALPAMSAVAPPPGAKTSEVLRAGEEARRAAARRKGMRTSILAGETGGYRGNLLE
jgi:hypothetical protein